MALPGHRRTSSHKRRRASHFALTTGAIQHCAKCKKAVRPHRVCPFCGYYKGRQVIKKGPAAKKAAPAKKATATKPKKAKKTPAKKAE